MQQNIEITTRELLRDFKKYKTLLKDKKVGTIVLPIENGEKINISLAEKTNTGRNIAKAIRAIKKPIEVTRPKGLFDDLFTREYD